VSALLALQRGFQARLLGRAAAAEPATVDVASDVVVRPNADVSERLCIYEHAYAARLIEALGRTYAVLRTVLGTTAFDEIAAAFVRVTPSRHRSIRDYGSELGDFVARSWPGLDGETWSELAAWEWLLADVFDAAGATPASVAELARIAPEEWAALRFRAHPTLRRYRSATNAIEVWKRVSSAELAARASPADGLPACARHGPVEWLAWRRELTTHYRPLEPGEARALDALLNGVSFGEVCEGLAETGDATEAPLRAAQYLRGWIESGLVE
jgi:hypothetical protein